MRFVSRLVLLSAFLGLSVLGSAQEPAKKEEAKKTTETKDATLVTKMLAFDTNKDGKLSKDEVTGEAELKIFNRADANKDGTVTKAELVALAAQEAAVGETPRGGERGREGGGDRGREGGGGRGPGGPGGFEGGRGGFGRMPQPGQLLPVFFQEQLKLSDEQKKKVEELQKETETKLDKILTDEQRKTLKEMKERGPMGGPGGRGPGGEGGRPGGEGGRPGGERRPGGDR
jgi:hypothetical protein